MARDWRFHLEMQIPELRLGPTEQEPRGVRRAVLDILDRLNQLIIAFNVIGGFMGGKGTTDTVMDASVLTDLTAVETKLGITADPEDNFFVRIIRVLKLMNSV